MPPTPAHTRPDAGRDPRSLPDPLPDPRLRHLLHPDHAGEYATAARLAVDHVATALGRVTGPVTGLDPQRAAKPVRDVDLDRPLGCTVQALAELDRVWLDDTVWFHEPGYAAHLNCPVVVPALVAEVLLSAVNPSLDTFDQSIGGTFVERHLVDWVCGRIGFGAGADGVFTSGGTQSNLQGLHLARDHALARPGAALERLRILVSTDGHFSVQRAARLLGLSPDAVVPVAVDERRRMRPDALAAALGAVGSEGAGAMAVVATAGTTDHGSIDPLPAVADLAHAHRAWLHVDAAYGGGLLVSPRRRHLLDGIERADSVTVDFHKTWFQPVSCSAVLVRERRHLRHVTCRADYLNPADGGGTDVLAPNQVDKSLQTTRRFDALKLWLTLRVMGADTVGGYVDAVVDLAQAAYARLRDDERVEVLQEPQLSTLLLRPHRPGLTAAQVDALVPRVRAALWAGGEHVVAATVVEGRRWLKLTLLNPLATVDDVLSVVEGIVAAADDLLGEEAA